MTRFVSFPRRFGKYFLAFLKLHFQRPRNISKDLGQTENHFFTITNIFIRPVFCVWRHSCPSPSWARPALDLMFSFPLPPCKTTIHQVLSAHLEILRYVFPNFYSEIKLVTFSSSESKRRTHSLYMFHFLLSKKVWN